MAYMGFCVECHHFYASVGRKAVVLHLINHSKKCHKGNERFGIVRISAKGYQDYLANKDNSAFWTAWNNFKKPQIIAKIYPLFSLIG